MSWESMSLFLLRVKKVLAASRTPSGRRALKAGVAPSIEHRHLSDLEVAHVLDIGANRGQFSLFAAQAWNTESIDAFEPLPQCAAAVETLLPYVSVHRLALSDREGEQQFHVSRSDDSSSLRSITDNQEKFFPRTEEAESLTVSVATFESWAAGRVFKRPCFAKIDVQGSELDVIRGMGSAIDQIDFVYAELSFLELYKDQALAGEVIAYLDNLGFKLVGVYNLKQRGVQAIQADALFSRNDGVNQG